MNKQSIQILILLIAVTASSFAQISHPKKIIKPAHFDVSRRLSEVEPIIPGERQRSWKNNTVKNFDGFLDEFKNEPIMLGDDPVLQKSQRSSATPQVVHNFSGVANLNGVAPPDTDGDVGPNHYFQMINLSFSIWDKEGNQLMAPADNQTLWEGFDDGKPFDNANDGDPIVVYDEYADRWIATQFALNTSNNKYYELIAVSATPDPLGVWYRYAYEFDNLPDYPKFGVWPDGYYFSINQFDNWQWAGGGICAVDRDAMINGDPNAEMVFFDLGTGFGSLLPADADGDMLPPEGSPQYFMSMGMNNLKMWEVDIDWNNPQNSTSNYLGIMVTEQFSTSGISIPQRGTSQELASLSGRLMYRLQYRNFGDYEVLVTNHTVKADESGRAGVRWYELRKYPGDDWEIYQQGTFAPNDGLSRWMASAAMNDHGDIAIGYSVSGPMTYPSIRFAGQMAGAANGLGVLDVEETSILEGSKSQSGIDRWGDYASMSIDPSDGTTFWFTTEWTNGGWGWRTQIASMDFTQIPKSDFTVDESLIPVGETVNFTDISSGNPTEWEWTFEGGTPSSSTDENPTNILYANEGVFSVTLKTQNSAGENEITKTFYIEASSTLMPDVSFEVDNKFGCLSDIIHLSDQTQYKPIEWNWEISPISFHFTGGTDANSQNPSVIFEEAIKYSISLTATNLNGSSSITKTDEIMAGGYQPYFFDGFENDGFNRNYWQVENPDEDVTWDIYSVGGTDPGFFAAGIELDEYYPPQERDRLISPPFNLQDMSNAILEFEYAYAKRHSKDPDSLIILVSDNCGNTWTRVFANAEDGSGNFATAERQPNFWPESYNDWCGAGWGASCINIDLNNWVGQTEVRIAFESYNEYGNPMFIDNVSISQYLGEIENVEENEISVYPNPSTGVFHILLPENHNFNSSRLYNQFGQVILQKSINTEITNFEIKLNQDFPKGIYYLKVEGKESSTTKKLIVY